MQNTAAVFHAIHNGDLDQLQQLVAADPACAAARDAAGVSALMQARYGQRIDMVETLLAAKPPLDVFEAATFGRSERLVEILEGEPAAALAWSPDGFTALHFAAFFAQPDAAAALLEAGADPGAASRNPMQLTPLNSAVAARQRSIAALLLARGVDANARQAGGWTSLHSAAHNGEVELVELLLAHGADPRIESDDGRDAAAMARERNHETLASRLAGPNHP